MATSTSGTVSTVGAAERNATIVSHRRRPDPLVAMYLKQIRQCPLLTHSEEQCLGERLRHSRELFRRSVLYHDNVQKLALALLKQVHDRSLRFDRVVNIGVREKARKREIESVIAATLRPLASLVRQNDRDRKALTSEVPSAVRNRLRSRLRLRRTQAVAMIERIGLRLQFIERWWYELVPTLEETADGARRLLRIQRVHREFKRAKRRLARHNVRLVVSIAKRYQHPEMSFLDLIQEGNIGLLAAVDKFEPRRGLRFSTYATWWIIQMIRKSIIEKTRSVRLPVAAADRVDRITAMLNETSQTLGRRLSREEVECVAKLQGDEYQWIPNATVPTVSLDQTVGSTEDFALHESLLQEREALPEDSAGRTEIRNIVNEILSRWDPRERAIIKLRFGLESPQTLTLEEVGSKLRISRERVRQLEKASLARLREQLAFVHA